MTFKIKHRTIRLRIISALTVIIGIAAVLLIPVSEEAKFYTAAAFGAVWSVTLIFAVIESVGCTKLVIGNETLKIKHVIGGRLIRISEISDISYDRFPVLHKASVQPYGGLRYYEEYRVRLTVNILGAKGTQSVILNDEGSKRRDKLFTAKIIYDDIPDEEIPLYNAYELLKRRMRELSERIRQQNA